MARDNGTEGDCYNQTDATAGTRLWWATTTGTPATWTLQAGAGGGGGSGYFNYQGQGSLITGNGSPQTVYTLSVPSGTLTAGGAAGGCLSLEMGVLQVASATSMQINLTWGATSTVLATGLAASTPASWSVSICNNASSTTAQLISVRSGYLWASMANTPFNVTAAENTNSGSPIVLKATVSVGGSGNTLTPLFWLVTNNTGGGGGVGAVASVAGTANQIACTPTTGSVVCSIPSSPVIPGAPTISDGTNFQHTHANAANGGKISGPSGINGQIPIANLASGSPSGSKFIRDDGVLAVPSGGGGGGSPSCIASVSSTVLTIMSTAASLTPCPIGIGNSRYSFSATTTVTFSAGAGTGTVWVELIPGGTISVRHNLTNADVACSGCTKVAAASGFSPSNSTPILSWTVTSDLINATGGIEYYPTVGYNQSITTGTCLVGDGVATPLAIDTACVPIKLVGSSALNFPSIANASYADLTFTLTGALTSGAVSATCPPTLAAGLSCIMTVSAADTINVRVINLSGGAVDPPSLTYGVTVLQ